MEQLIQAVKEQIEKDKRPPNELYSFIKQLGLYMITTNTMSKENVVLMTASMLRLYKLLAKNDKPS